MPFPNSSIDTGSRVWVQQALASAITSEDQMFCQTPVSATGTNQATAFQTSNMYAFIEVTVTPSGSGIQLPISDPGDRYYVANNGLNTLTVYTNTLDPATSPKINATAGTSGVTQVAGNNAMYVCMTPGQYYRISGT